jgi:homocysteine S-methyltransferase
MKFEDTLKTTPVILTEGAVIERLNREDAIELDPFIANSGLIYDDTGKNVMNTIYRQYIDIGFRYNLPIIISAPTWRASPERISKSNHFHRKHIIRDCVKFIREIRKDYTEYSDSVFVSGLMGCRGDAYDPGEALSIQDARTYHLPQAQQLTEAGVDFILAATLPAVSEALGIAAATSECGAAYSLSFVIRENGEVLDGTPLQAAIERIDAVVENKPLFYQVNCVHPTVFRQAIDQNQTISDRLIGLQANTSAKSPEELDGLDYLDTSDPKEFAESIVSLHKKFGTKIIGGCCGTDHRHIDAIARKLRSDNLI